MQWLTFLQRTLTAAAAATAGATATAATANPLLGTAAGAAAKTATEDLLAEFLPAQQEAMDQLLERTNGIERALGAIQSDLQALMDAKWQAALFHIADAAQHPERARDELHRARGDLYDAWGAARPGAKRALISQELSVVHALLGEPDDSRNWLMKSWPDTHTVFRDGASGLLVDSLTKLPRFNGRPRSENAFTLDVPEGPLAVYSHALHRPAFWVWESPLTEALDSLARARLEDLTLRRVCAEAGMHGPWPSDEPSAHGGVLVGDRPYVSLALSPTDTVKFCLVRGGETHMVSARTILRGIGRWRFQVEGPRLDWQANVFVSGSSPELGHWQEELAICLNRKPRRDDTVMWWGELDVLAGDQSDPVDYKYFYRLKPDEPAVWESGSTRRMSPAPPAKDQADKGALREDIDPLLLTREARDVWQHA